jgi:hypothetical protein
MQGVTAAGYVLDYAAQGLGMVQVTSGNVDADGIAGSSVTLTANPGPSASFICWLVNGVEDLETSPVLVLTMNGHKTVRAVFIATWTVSSTADSGAGSLREALFNAMDGDVIALQGQTIALATPLDPITKSLEIRGNGATLTIQNGFAPIDTTSQLLYINSITAVVRISRLHFKGGIATNYGGAIQNAEAKLILESCIFSDNNAAGGSAATYGGALYISGTSSNVTVSGCTFYGNSVTTTSTNQGGAIYRNGSSTLTLTGNLFWGNTATSYSVARASTSPAIVSSGYNIADKAINNNTTTGSGWANAGTDAYMTDVITFDEDYKPSSAASLSIMPSPLPEGFPTTYFDGSARGTTPGAMPSN